MGWALVWKIRGPSLSYINYLFFFNKFSCAYLYGETPGVVQFIQDYRSSSTVFFRCSLNDLVTFQLKVIAVGRVVPPAPLQIKSK